MFRRVVQWHRRRQVPLRTEAEQAEARERRRAILDGFLLAAERRHDLVDVIHGAATREELLARVQTTLDVDEWVSYHVLDMPLRSLAGHARDGVRAELAALLSGDPAAWPPTQPGPRLVGGIISRQADDEPDHT